MSVFGLSTDSPQLAEGNGTGIVGAEKISLWRAGFTLLTLNIVSLLAGGAQGSSCDLTGLTLIHVCFINVPSRGSKPHPGLCCIAANHIYCDHSLALVCSNAFPASFGCLPLPSEGEKMRTRVQATAPGSPRQGLRSSRPLLAEQGARPDELLLTETLAFSIPQFCRRHSISRAHFYNLSKSGHGPALMRVGRRTLISAEAAAEWRRRMEQVGRDAVSDCRGAGS